MASLQRAVIDRLRADVVVRELLHGGIYPFSPRKEGFEAAPDAFDESGRVKPCATVLVDDLVRIAVGQATRPVRVRVRANKVWVEKVEAGVWEVRRVLHRAQLATEHEGAGVPLEWRTVVTPQDDPDYSTCYMGEVEFVAAAGPDD